MSDILYKGESYMIIGKCMEVHNQLGWGFSEVVYKDALEYEFNAANIFFEREKKYPVTYKKIILPHFFYADFVIMNKIILEVKAVKKLTDEHTALAINYCAVSQNKLALLVNFGREKLDYKRIVV